MPRKPRRSKAPVDVELPWVGYGRVSTDEQAEDGTSLVNQEDQIRGYAALYKLPLTEVIVDAGLSAKTLERPGLGRCLVMLDKWEVRGIVIAKLDRLTRSLGDWDFLIKTYFSEHAGRQLASVKEVVDTRTSNGRMMLNLMVMIAQWERETTAERTKDALQGKIKRGERCGKLRYGYDISDDGKTLMLNRHEQGIIKKLKAWRAQGWTYQRIVDELHVLRVETKEGGRKWFPSTLHRILNRPIA